MAANMGAAEDAHGVGHVQVVRCCLQAARQRLAQLAAPRVPAAMAAPAGTRLAFIHTAGVGLQHAARTKMTDGSLKTTLCTHCWAHWPSSFASSYGFQARAYQNRMPTSHSRSGTVFAAILPPFFSAPVYKETLKLYVMASLMSSVLCHEQKALGCAHLMSFCFMP